jgi:phosphopantothenoylcysteine decarboxylase/phosphopantothenate--cysteine ligase
VREASRLRLVVGVSGGIAAYKAVGAIRAFVLDGHDVQVVATQAAYEFVGKSTLEAISHNPVYDALYDDVSQVRHVSLGQNADAVVIAPATANTLASIVAGLAPDLLGNTVLARRGPLIVAPAMHTEMWQNAATVHNVAVLRERGVIVVDPASGALTGNDVGVGRMAEVHSIVSATYAAVGRAVRDLDGVRVLITGGGTREALDPVRFIGNSSSGRQAVALAEAARVRGASVHFVSGHMDVEPPSGIELTFAGTAAEMHAAVLSRLDETDVLIMAAAVADYRPAVVSERKLKKTTLGQNPTIELVENPDILAEAARHPRCLVIGFAAETAADDSELLTLARQKAASKGAAAIVANRVERGRGIGSPENDVIIVSGDGRELGRSSGEKLSVAQSILDVVAQLRSH